MVWVRLHPALMLTSSIPASLTRPRWSLSMPATLFAPSPHSCAQVVDLTGEDGGAKQVGVQWVWMWVWVALAFVWLSECSTRTSV
jgi:hypothetical protein